MAMWTAVLQTGQYLYLERACICSFSIAPYQSHSCIIRQLREIMALILPHSSISRLQIGQRQWGSCIRSKPTKGNWRVSVGQNVLEFATSMHPHTNIVAKGSISIKLLKWSYVVAVDPEMPRCSCYLVILIKKLTHSLGFRCSYFLQTGLDIC